MLSQDVTSHRLQFLTEIIRLLLTMVPQQRGRVLRDEATEYTVDTDDVTGELNPAFNVMLNNIPFTNL